MATNILIPAPLRLNAGRQSVIEVAAQTLGEVVGDLFAKHPDMRKNLLWESYKLRSFVNVYLNYGDIRYLSKEAIPVKGTDTIAIVPLVAAGRSRAARVAS